jgi:exopolysaccharide biosynthesis polyprenyl glycosylphosphotransferase
VKSFLKFLLSSRNHALGNGSADEVQGLLPEPMFLRALCLERKRAERSRKPFVLMLLDPRTPFHSGDGATVLHSTISALRASMRETDIAGWYKASSVPGVIFAELGPADKQSVLSALQTRVTATLRSVLNAEALKHIHISFHYFPEDWGAADTAPLTTTATLYPDLAQRDATRRVSRLIKRTVDVAGSAMALIILAPILFVIAVAIKLSSPGPVLFRQKRIAQYGVPFTCLKFRSMYSGSDSSVHMKFIKRYIAGNVDRDAPGAGKVVYKITDDPRVTRVGRFLRKTSLDELPQFLNVLQGEMSLVGPRPPIPYELEAYDVWHRRRFLEVKPGITGLWQVNGRSRSRFDDMVRLDLKYAKAWSLSLDIKILLQTPQAVFSGDGAY